MSDNVEHVRARPCRRKRERYVANLVHSAMLQTRFINAVAKNNPAMYASVAAAAAVWKKLQEQSSSDMFAVILAEFEEAIIKIEQE